MIGGENTYKLQIVQYKIHNVCGPHRRRVHFVGLHNRPNSNPRSSIRQKRRCTTISCACRVLSGPFWGAHPASDRRANANGADQCGMRCRSKRYVHWHSRAPTVGDCKWVLMIANVQMKCFFLWMTFFWSTLISAAREFPFKLNVSILRLGGKTEIWLRDDHHEHISWADDWLTTWFSDALSVSFF